MKKCENCQTIHNGNYGSGRFCSEKCSRSFSTKNVDNKELKIVICISCNDHFKVTKRARVKNYKCIECRKTTKTCKGCNKDFKTMRDNTYCSRKCSTKASLDLAREAQKNLDWSAINKKSYAEGKNYVAGGTTEWIPYKDIKVQGSYELRACVILDKMKEMNLIKDWEYTKDKHPYIDVDGSKRTYFLDFKVFLENDFYYVETKGYSTETDEAKWKSIRDKGIRLDVWFNEDLEKLEKKLL